jgi:hypothetical protein
LRAAAKLPILFGAPTPGNRVWDQWERGSGSGAFQLCAAGTSGEVVVEERDWHSATRTGIVLKEAVMVRRQRRGYEGASQCMLQKGRLNVKTEMVLCGLLVFGLSAGVSARGQAAPAQTNTPQTSTPAQAPAPGTPKAKGRSAGGDIGSGSGDIGKGAGKGAGNLAAGTGKGAADLATLHPVNAAGAVGEGGAKAAKNVGEGTAKGTGKVAKGVGKALKHPY